MMGPGSFINSVLPSPSIQTRNFTTQDNAQRFMKREHGFYRGRVTGFGDPEAGEFFR